MPRLHGMGHKALMAVVCLSVCAVTDPKSRKEAWSSKLAGMKPMTQLTRDPI